MSNGCPITGRGQPLSLALSFGESPCFDNLGEIRRCDWLKNIHNLWYPTGLMQKCKVFSQSQRRIPPDHQIKEFRQTTVRATVEDSFQITLVMRPCSDELNGARSSP